MSLLGEKGENDDPVCGSVVRGSTSFQRCRSSRDTSSEPLWNISFTLKIGFSHHTYVISKLIGKKVVEPENDETECLADADVVHQFKLQADNLQKACELVSVLVAALHHLMH